MILNIFALLLTVSSSLTIAMTADNATLEQSIPVSQLLAKEAIKLRIGQKKLENTSNNVLALTCDYASFELFKLESGDMCIITNFYVDSDLAMDALKIQSIKKNPSINPYNQLPILARLRVALFEMNEENNQSLSPKAVDAQTVIRYVIGNNHEQVIRCVTCLSVQQFSEYILQAFKELVQEQKNGQENNTQEALAKIIAFDREIIKKIIADMPSQN